MAEITFVGIKSQYRCGEKVVDMAFYGGENVYLGSYGLDQFKGRRLDRNYWDDVYFIHVVIDVCPICGGKHYLKLDLSDLFY